ncbi:redoxin domain-containing protein (plasmid) [Rathayibacter sp. VKM Ac-2759]|uniref:TlpA family protein disulfide reductase n=1 Tax=Rathayibacter sp. VKM Ac-2759 TaxID=2609252 RepID=UPI00131670D1|nr:TlpA disulfide reductase family protein [Rathayibacter sp. VKM Ac-2759]QHC68782.1 redoxin domain-containing protein [Rathayibacter sp. VKM Ac-2759]
MTGVPRRTLLTLPVIAAVALATTGCAQDELSEQYRTGSNKNYVAGDGTVVEWPAETRGEPVEFTGLSETGETITAEDYRGTVLVVNFWYAACAPCRAEAPDLQALYEQYTGQGAEFLGVNVRDQADTAAAFAQTYGITYPSIVDVDAAAQLAFSGEFAANAVPTTIVLDAEGRPASRILGRVTARSILDTLIADAIAESAP